MDYEICPMEPKYAQGRGYVHFTAWQETYGELMDERFLRAHTLKACVDYALERPDNGFVALAEGSVVGFACLNGEARDFVTVPAAAEIVALYVLSAYQGQGIGSALLGRCFSAYPGRDFALFVLAGNERAIRFYERRGFGFTGKALTEERDGAQIVEMEMVRRHEA